MPFHCYVRKALRTQCLSRFGLDLRGPHPGILRSPELLLHAHCGLAQGQELGLAKWAKKYLTFPPGTSSQSFLPLNAKEG